MCDRIAIMRVNVIVRITINQVIICSNRVLIIIIAAVLL